MTNEQMQKRIEELEAALRPFANAADGFELDDLYIEYMETDGNYYELNANEIEAEFTAPLMTRHLIQAHKVLFDSPPADGG